MTIDDVLPTEYREIANRLFPSTREGAHGMVGFQALESVEDFAKLLGVGSELSKALNSTDSLDLKRLLVHFRNNLELLVHKTWVEKADEANKEKLLNRIPQFIAEIEQRQYSKALTSFITLVQELAYLLFGAQSHKDDFIEYTFRIDPQIGLFWWYTRKLDQVAAPQVQQTTDIQKAYLLIGICFLASI
ncbi:MAG: hypothetical protein SNJ56_04715 [Termitinemataceae bacterium]